MSEGGTIVSEVQEEQITESEPVEEESKEEEREEKPEKENDTKDETAHETVKRVLKEAKEEAVGDDDTGEEGPKSPTPEAKQDKKPVEKEEKLTPPARFDVSEKETFNTLTPEMKKAVNKMTRNHEAAFTKAMQTARGAEQEARHIIEVVRPYLLSKPDLQDKGFTEAKIVRNLLTAHQRLMDPETSREVWEKMGRDLGHIQGDSYQPRQGTSTTPAGAVNPAIQQRLDRVESFIGTQEEQARNQRIGSITAEMEAVQNEQDANGKYIYPRLHEDAFLDQVKPLVSALMGNIPNLTYGEALKRAYHSAEGTNGNSQQLQQAGLPAQNNTRERATSAAVSVRGKSTPNAVRGDLKEIPDEALGSAQDTVAWALKRLRRGG